MTSETMPFESAYVFNLHLLCGGYAYFSTYSRWDKWGDHYREFRCPREMNGYAFSISTRNLGYRPQFLRSCSDYESWATFGGWATVPVDVARSCMSQWLKSQQCVRSSNGTFTDIAICSPNALNHHASQGKRNTVVQRDGEKCILCERTPSDGIELTMQHVKPFGRGGETTTRNLVALCAECNGQLKDEEHPSLYKLAGLPHGYDLGLFHGTKPSKKNFHQVVRLSNNLMHTRCEVW